MDTQFDTIAQALHYLVEHQREQPGLKQLANYLGHSEGHVQRIFQSYVGLSPKQYVRMLTREQALRRLSHGSNVLDAALDSGLSGSGRLHDLLISTDAMTPGEARRRGAGVDLEFGVGPSPFGKALVAWSARGLVFLGFEQSDRARCMRELAEQWPDARLEENAKAAREWIKTVFEQSRSVPLKIWLRGSPFQLKVWEALMTIPSGDHVSYGQIAQHLGNPRASRAVGTAVGRNPISWLIPCHRVITSTGSLGGYRWGLSAKQAMIGVESAWTDFNAQGGEDRPSSSTASRSAASSGEGIDPGFSPR